VKRKFSAIAALICCLLGGCAPVEKEIAPLKKLVKVLSTTTMIDDVVLRVGGDRISHSVLIIGEIDPHSYELVKGDDEKIDEADLVFFNGLNLEHGASLRYKISSHSSSIGLGDYILETYPDEVLYEQNQVDPHIWMDVSLWSYTIDPILQALISKDPEGKEYYEGRARMAYEEMIHFHENLRQSLQEVPESRRFLVTSHDAFAYFTRAYLSTEEEYLLGTWKKRVAAPEGFAPDGQLGAADLRKIVEYLVEYNVHVVFPESNVSQDSLRKIVLACKEKKMNIRFSPEPLYGDSMGPKGKASGTYLGMMGYDADILIKEWK